MSDSNSYSWSPPNRLTSMPDDNTRNRLMNLPGGPTNADAWDATVGAAGRFMTAQRAQSAAMGLMDPNTGLPTQAGIGDIAKQYTNALMMGTTSPGVKLPSGSIAGAASSALASTQRRVITKSEASAFSKPDNIADGKFILPDGRILGAYDEAHEMVAGELGYGTQGEDSVAKMLHDTGAVRIGAANAIFGVGGDVQIVHPPTPSQVSQLSKYLKAKNQPVGIEYGDKFQQIGNGLDLSRFLATGGK